MSSGAAESQKLAELRRAILQVADGLDLIEFLMERHPPDRAEMIRAAVHGFAGRLAADLRRAIQ